MVITANPWNKVQAETIQKRFKKAGFVTTQDVAAPLGSPLPMEGFEGVDFEEFVAMDDDVAMCNEPDLEAIFQSVWNEVQPSGKMLEVSNEAEELSEELGEEDTEIADIPKEEDVSHLIRQLKSFAVEKCPGI